MESRARWLRFSQRSKTAPEETFDSSGILREFQGILNKLTPQRLDKLTEQALALKIDSAERLRGCVDLIFKNVLKGPMFCALYASLCRSMSQVRISVKKMENGKEIQRHMTFHRELLARCQQEFEKGVRVFEDLEKASYSSTTNKSSIVQFFMELFKHKMLSIGIMYEYMRNLLYSSTDKASLECFCWLASAIGKELDSKQAQEQMNVYFAQVRELRPYKNISFRVRFMLEDVIELGTHRWIPKRKWKIFPARERSN